MTVGDQVRRAERTGPTVELENGLRVERLGRPVNEDTIHFQVVIPGKLLRMRGISAQDQQAFEEEIIEWVATGLANRAPSRREPVV